MLIGPPSVTRNGECPFGVNTVGLKSGWLCAISATFCFAWSSRLYVKAITRQRPRLSPAAFCPAGEGTFPATTRAFGAGFDPVIVAVELFVAIGALSCATGAAAGASCTAPFELADRLCTKYHPSKIIRSV